MLEDPHGLILDKINKVLFFSMGGWEISFYSRDIRYFKTQTDEVFPPTKPLKPLRLLQCLKVYMLGMGLSSSPVSSVFVCTTGSSRCILTVHTGKRRLIELI